MTNRKFPLNFFLNVRPFFGLFFFGKKLFKGYPEKKIIAQCKEEVFDIK